VRNIRRGKEQQTIGREVFVGRRDADDRMHVRTRVSTGLRHLFISHAETPSRRQHRIPVDKNSASVSSNANRTADFFFRCDVDACSACKRMADVGNWSSTCRCSYIDNADVYVNTEQTSSDECLKKLNNLNEANILSHHHSLAELVQQ
jgi:hypothetical protein